MNSRSTIKSTYRSTGDWTLVMITPPWARFQTWGTGGGTRLGTFVMNTALATGFLALVVASLVLGMTRASTEVLAIQRALARMLYVVYACD